MKEKILGFILNPIRNSPIAFIFYGVLLFLPEMFQVFSYERGIYIGAHFLTTIAFSYAISWIICAIAFCLRKWGGYGIL